MLPCSLSNTSFNPSGSGGWREIDSSNPFPSSFGKEAEGSLWKSQGPEGYLAQGYCSRHRTMWATSPLLHGSIRGGHTVSTFLLSLTPDWEPRTSSSGSHVAAGDTRHPQLGSQGPRASCRCAVQTRMHAHVFPRHSAADRLPTWWGGGGLSPAGAHQWKL